MDDVSAVSQFSSDWSAAQLTAPGVGSPLGLWLLLALLAPATQGADRVELERVLGCDAMSAARSAGVLLSDPPPSIRAALAVWAQNAAASAEFGEWVSALPAVVEVGPVPAQSAADRWVAERTLGLISSLPAALSADSVAVLVSALATKGEWVSSFSEVPSQRAGGRFAAVETDVLQSTAEHQVGVVDTKSAGRVGVLLAETVEGLLVVSVAADVGVPVAACHRAAAEVLADHVVDGVLVGTVPVGELGVSADGLWETSTRMLPATSAPSVPVAEAWMLPWKLSSMWDLSTVPGVAEVAAVLNRWFDQTAAVPPVELRELEVRQCAVASMSRTGFEAAAVTVMHLACASWVERVPVEVLSVRFDRPFAVVAVVSDVDSVWASVPVFAAWVDPGV
jgi:hypothetical protein